MIGEGYIDEFNTDHSGWARFSEDRTMRYRLARALVPGTLEIVDGIVRSHALIHEGPLLHVVFLMLNPSTADAFKLDPTVTNCVKFARRWGAHILEVVNLFAFRSPYPEYLVAASKSGASMGADPMNNDAIVRACHGLVIAAFGNHGELRDRGNAVVAMLRAIGVKLHHLGMTKSGMPKHPLARGKHRIPDDQQPIPWAA